MRSIIRLGIFDKFQPKFCKRYAQVGSTIADAIEHYTKEVSDRAFPTMAHSYNMPNSIVKAFIQEAAAVPGTLPVDGDGLQAKFATSKSSPPRSPPANGAPAAAPPAPAAAPSSAVGDGGKVASHCSTSSARVNTIIAPPIEQVVVIGGGAMGSLLASRIASRSNASVALLSTWNEHIQAIHQNGGLKLQHLSDVDSPAAVAPWITTSRRVVATSNVAQVLEQHRADRATAVFVLGKGAEQSRAAAGHAAAILARNPYNMLVTLQNGLGYADLLESVLGDSDRVLSGITCEGARVVQPGHVMHTGHGPTVLLPRTLLQEAVADRLIELLGGAGFQPSLVPCDNPSLQQGVLWSKLLINSAINPLSAIMRVSNGELLAAPRATALIKSVVDETMRVALASKVQIPFGSTDDALERVHQVARATAANRSSMCTDIERGSPSEIDFINGHVVRTGQTCGVATPVNETLVSLIHALEQTNALKCGALASSPIDQARTAATLPAAARATSTAARIGVMRSVTPTVVATQQLLQRASQYSTSSIDVATDGRPQVIESLSGLRQLRRIWRLKNMRVGFVPTMGALHDGHLELVRQAQQSCDAVVVSIFVNPTQFAPHEDLEHYPRTLARDIDRLASLTHEAVDDGESSGSKPCVVYAPSVVEMYGNVQTGGRTNAATMVVLDNIEGKCHESLSRPGFFTGVATVVSKLFNMVQPDDAFFGQKDAIQCIVVKQLVRDLNFPINVQIVPTMREADGLAMSSRNQYLSPLERSASPVVYRSLVAAQQLCSQHQQTPVTPSAVRAAVTGVLATEPLVASIDYVSIADANSGIELVDNDQPIASPEVLVSLAVRIGTTRLIDNVVISIE
jgi:pantoate--beta-alanine ligase